MTVRIVVFLTCVLLVISLVEVLLAAEWYVAPPPLGNDRNPGTEQQPFANIQKGINSAKDSDTVIVAQGTYVENIRFGGKNIVLTSTNPLDWSVVASTIIDGNQSGSVVAFDSTEDQTCMLSGFTIRNGSGSDYVSPAGTRPGGGGILGGDDYTSRTQATIRNNMIVGNSATEGAGIAICDGLIQNNLLIGNHADPSQPGGALTLCNGIIEGNLIAGNTSTCGGAFPIAMPSSATTRLSGTSPVTGAVECLCAGLGTTPLRARRSQTTSSGETTRLLDRRFMIQTPRPTAASRTGRRAAKETVLGIRGSLIPMDRMTTRTVSWTTTIGCWPHLVALMPE